MQFVENFVLILTVLTTNNLVGSFKSYEGFSESRFGVESDIYFTLPDL